MDIQDAARISFDDARPQHRQETCQNHEVDIVTFQHIQQGCVEIFTLLIILAADDHALNASVCRAFQCVDAGFRGHHQLDLAVGIFAPCLAVQQGLQIGAAARN